MHSVSHTIYLKLLILTAISLETKTVYFDGEDGSTGAYIIYVRVNTIQGHRWLFYNHLNVDVGFHGAEILNGIRNKTNNGTWQSFTQDLQAGISTAEENNELISINSIIVRGSGRLDDIVAF